MTVLLFVKGKCKNKFLFIFLLDIYHSDAYIHHKARGTLETSSKNRVFLQHVPRHRRKNAGIRCEQMPENRWPPAAPVFKKN